jgi:hypothetical protein
MAGSVAAAYAAMVRTCRRSIVGWVGMALIVGVVAATVPAAAARAAQANNDVFAFGDAQFYGSTGGTVLNHRIVGMAATRSGHGYWLVAADGGIFSFGDAHFYGSTGGTVLNQPIVGMAATPSGHGYWLVGGDGRVFAQGDAIVNGTVWSPTFVTESIVAIVSRSTRQGFWLAAGAVPIAGAKIEAAIGWFDTRLGDRTFEDQCEAAVEASFGTIGRYPSAYRAWLAQPDPHFDWRDAPRGTLVFYKPDIFGADGHVAISLGDGYVISTSVYGGIGIAPIDAFQNPLGWTYEPW